MTIQKVSRGAHSSIASHKSDLRQGILESDILSGLRVPHIGLVVPTTNWLAVNKGKDAGFTLCLLRDLGDHQSPRYIGDPVCKFEAVRVIIDIWSCREMVATCDCRLRSSVDDHMVTTGADGDADSGRHTGEVLGQIEQRGERRQALSSYIYYISY